MAVNKNDVVIVGGGLVGLFLSCFLGKLGLSISIVDKESITDSYSINKDLRTTAISEGSKVILDSYGVWKKIKNYAQPIKYINVFDRSDYSKISFKNSKKNNFLGYIIKNQILKKTLIDEIKYNKKIRIIDQSSVQNIETSNDFVFVSTKKTNLYSSLLVAADGRGSYVRKILKQPIFTKKYDHNALVVNFSHTKNHNNTAYEIFYDSGPLATLPMVKELKNKNYSSLVWSHNPKFIKSLFNIDNNLLSLIIDEHTEKYLGKINKIISRQFFSLSSHINSSFYNNRLVYVGDAAHSIHPIAGQGWNLGMRDIDELYKIIDNAIFLGIDLGSNFVCEKYQKRRYFDAFSLYQITDKLNSIFMFDNIGSKMFRKIGFDIINKNKILNSKISNYAMGKKL